MVTSNLDQFRQMLENPGVPIDPSTLQQSIAKIKKNLILTFQSDYSGCGHIRQAFHTSYLNAVFGKQQELVTK